MNSPSPDSGRYERDISSSHAHAVQDKDIKLEENGKGCDLKRKKEHSEGSAENRTAKYRKSSSVENKIQQQSQSGVNDLDDEDEKRKASKISYVMAENATLRQQLGAGVMCPPPPPAPGMYPHPPMPPMPYPWMPCAPYVVKPQGSQGGGKVWPVNGHKNGSERNDKMVKIDGNLIIHSIMASEKAMASQLLRQRRTRVKLRRALGSGSTETLKDHMKSSATNGKMQQWFREGLAGPMLSSGMCTEVFQFDVSPTPGAIVPATSVANISTERHQNATTVTRAGIEESSTGSQIHFLLLVDPKEAGDGDVDGMMAPKSLSRIFVVVLMDSVKYVTYSCGLPRASPPLW
ncbi:hypothetical protein SESBI_49472 [Sesbania bispinosa]|nr:hypothetical protein SESBI_49472 [Sesbania bispinosa]